MQEFDPHKRPIIIHGSGNSAAITALALAAAGFRPLFSRLNSPSKDTTSSSVLALSAAAKTMLDGLSIWARLKTPAVAVCDMTVYGSAENWRRGHGLSFAEPINTQSTDKAAQDEGARDDQPAIDMPTIDILAHIVSLTDLSAAIGDALDAALSDDTIGVLPAPIDDFDKTDGTVRLENGETIEAALLIDTRRDHKTAKADAPWRRDTAALGHDYDMTALVASVHTAQPHGNKAVQLFLPDGPLALLPLAAPDKRALIWSMPKGKAAALADIGQPFIDTELAKATGGAAGAIRADDDWQIQHLSLKLADAYCDGHLCLLGEAAHIVHPLAGQGFNLTLRDAALLADCLYEARGLGLAADGPYVLSEFVTKRRGDAAMTAAMTHALADLFSGPAKNLTGPLGRFGLALTGRMARHNQALRQAFRRQADGRGTSTPPRLMRSGNFQ